MFCKAGGIVTDCWLGGLKSSQEPFPSQDTGAAQSAMIDEQAFRQSSARPRQPYCGHWTSSQLKQKTWGPAHLSTCCERENESIYLFPFWHCTVMSAFSHTMSRLDFDFFSPVFGSADEGIFKAGTERSETRGAAEVQEDEDTQVEVPVDQVILTPLSIHGNWNRNFGSPHVLRCQGVI